LTGCMTKRSIFSIMMQNQFVLLFHQKPWK